MDFISATTGGLWAKLSAFEESSKVPFLMAGAGLPAGRVISAPAELLDLYPTLVDFAGLPPTAGLEGRSLRPVVEGRETAGARVAHSLVYHYDPVRAIDILGRSVLAEHWRYTEWDGGREGREFYWHDDDASEYRNRVDDPKVKEAVLAGTAQLQQAPSLKPGPAERPGALLPPKAPKAPKK